MMCVKAANLGLPVYCAVALAQLLASCTDNGPPQVTRFRTIWEYVVSCQQLDLHIPVPAQCREVDTELLCNTIWRCR